MATAAPANVAPFASTCTASRSPPFATIDAVLASLSERPNRDRSVEEAK